MDGKSCVTADELYLEAVRPARSSDGPVLRYNNGAAGKRDDPCLVLHPSMICPKMQATSQVSSCVGAKETTWL